jgi:hypothetical protein
VHEVVTEVDPNEAYLVEVGDEILVATGGNNLMSEAEAAEAQAAKDYEDGSVEEDEDEDEDVTTTPVVSFAAEPLEVDSYRFKTKNLKRRKRPKKASR